MILSDAVCVPDDELELGAPPHALSATVTPAPAATRNRRVKNRINLSPPPQTVTSVTGLGRHLMRRLSSAVISDSATSATTARSSIPAKTPLASKLCSAL